MAANLVLTIRCDVFVGAGDDLLGEIKNFLLDDGVRCLEFVVVSGVGEIFGDLLTAIDDGGFTVLLGGERECAQGGKNNQELQMLND